MKNISWKWTVAFWKTVCAFKQVGVGLCRTSDHPCCTGLYVCNPFGLGFVFSACFQVVVHQCIGKPAAPGMDANMSRRWDLVWESVAWQGLTEHAGVCNLTVSGSSLALFNIVEMFAVWVHLCCDGEDCKRRSQALMEHVHALKAELS